MVRSIFRRCMFLAVMVLSAAPLQAADNAPIKILFLGDTGHHQPAQRFPQLKAPLAKRGIELTYSDSLDDLNAKTLAGYDGLLVFANQDKISPEQEAALLDFVAKGKGFIPLHCASFCFRNSEKYVELVGAQFQKHGTGTFRTTLAEADHPIMQGFGGFESWDETYVHHLHTEKDRTVLEYRVDESGREPWTWVRTHGKGRVFYTAWGHDGRTWSNPGFHNLMERGIRWAVGRDVSAVPTFADTLEMTPLRKDVKPLEFTDADVPFYPPGKQWGTIGENIKKMPKPLEAAESVKHMVTPVGFELKLFVSDPEIGKPLAMNWDERGRLWICETVDYPNELQQPGAGRDRIRICEDTDGDGKADKFTIFADKLSIPTSLVIARGGVIVMQAPDTLFLKDTNGDDVADERTVLFTGWGTSDTHAGPSNLNYGPDNWIYGIVGYSGFQGTIGGETHNFRQGFYRFKSDGSKMEFLRNTNNNSWGVGFSEEGILFGSTANANPSVYMPIPNRYYENVKGWSSTVLGGIAGNAEMHPITENVRQVDQHGHFTAAAGHALYTARNYPKIFWNRTSFVTEPTGHLIATFQISPDGADFHSANSWNLIASDDEWTAPTMAEVGPDGNVWIIDWYNYIVQHNPTPAGFKTGKHGAYETNLRDKTHGRVYRLVHTASKAGSPSITSLKDATPAQLVSALKSDNFFWRRQAQRLLVERAKPDVTAALIDLVKNTTQDEIGLNPAAMHALWTLQGLGQLEGQNAVALAAAREALKHPAVGVRRAAAMSLPKTVASATALIQAKLLSDGDAQVQLAALLMLAEMPADAAVGRYLASLVADEALLADRWLPDALAAAAAAQSETFLQGVANGPVKNPSPTFGQNPAAQKIIAVVAEHLSRQGEATPVAKTLASLEQAPASISGAILAGLAKGWPKDKKGELDASADEALVALLSKLPADQRGSLVLLATKLGSQKIEKYGQEVTASLMVVVQDESAKDVAKLAAANQLIDFRKSDPAAATKLLEAITPKTSTDFGTGLLDAIARSDSPATGKQLVDRLDSFTPSLRLVGLRILLSRAEWLQELLAAMDAGKVQFSELSLDQKQAIASHPDKAIAKKGKELLAKGGGLPNADRQKVVAEFMPVTKLIGDAVAGKQVFTKQCAKCHMHGELGNKIGPNLTGMAVHPKAELLTHLLDPNRNVEGNYRVYTVVTGEGVVLQGLLAGESKTSVEIFDAEGKKHQLLREDIETIKASPKSLMPEGFEKQFMGDDLSNLLEFLTQRGKYLPIPLDKAVTATSTKGMFVSEEADAERLIFDDWSPKTYEGIPFVLIDPQGTRNRNVILLQGPKDSLTGKLPKTVSLPCNAPAKAIHLLSGVSGWGFPYGEKGGITMIVRLHYSGGKTEDHPLVNGEHFADYIRQVDVPQSKLAFKLRGQQIRYLAVYPQSEAVIETIELLKGGDTSAPVVMAVTVEGK